MFARVTRYRMKPEAAAAAVEKVKGMKAQIMALPGMIQFINVMNEDGNGYVISVVESEEVSNANQDKVQAIWSLFADDLAEAPVAEGYSVIMNEANR